MPVMPAAEVVTQAVVDDQAQLLRGVKHLPGRVSALAGQCDACAVLRPERKLAPRSISLPLARDLVALVRSVGVLRASAGTVGRRASLNSTLLLLVHRHDAGAVRAFVASF